MDYSDTTVMIPVKDEPAVSEVAKGVFSALPGCRIVVIYKGNLSLKVKNKNLRIIKQIGSGKGVAVIQAAKLIHTNIMCLIDGDATYDPADLKKVIMLVRNGAEMALGDRMSRIKKGSMPPYVQLGNNVLTFTANLFYGLRIKDSQTGLRAVNKKVFDKLDLRETHFGIEEEMNIKTKKIGGSVVDVPINYYVRVGSSKQMKLLDGVKLLFITLKFLFI